MKSFILGMNVKTMQSLSGGHLATFSNLSEWLVAREELIADELVLQDGLPRANTVWLGGTDEISEGNWQWVTGAF